MEVIFSIHLDTMIVKCAPILPSYKINKMETISQIRTSFILAKLFENISRTCNRQCSLIFKYLKDLTVPWKDTHKNFKKSEIPKLEQKRKVFCKICI